MLVGYARVSTKDQNLDRQLSQLKQYGIDQRNIYQEKITGTKKDRLELQRMISELQQGDTVIVAELTRLSRSTKDLFEIVEQIEKKGANIKSLKESWLDTTTAHGKLLFTIFAGLTQFERDLISERTKEGLRETKLKGTKLGRPKRNSNKSKIKLVKQLRDEGKSMKEIMTLSGMSRTTVYRYLNEA